MIISNSVQVSLSFNRVCNHFLSYDCEKQRQIESLRLLKNRVVMKNLTLKFCLKQKIFQQMIQRNLISTNHPCTNWNSYPTLERMERNGRQLMKLKQARTNRKMCSRVTSYCRNIEPPTNAWIWMLLIDEGSVRSMHS